MTTTKYLVSYARYGERGIATVLCTSETAKLREIQFAMSQGADWIDVDVYEG